MKPEIIVRSILHKLGYRFRLHKNSILGRPDVVLSKHKKIIFVHGCFWHQHKKKSCKKAHLPKSNIEYWIPKLTRNVQRDEMHIKELKRQGWKILVIWECETNIIERLEFEIQKFMSTG